MLFTHFIGLGISLLVTCLPSAPAGTEKYTRAETQSITHPFVPFAAQDENHYYLIAGDSVRKVDRKSLKVVASGNLLDFEIIEDTESKMLDKLHSGLVSARGERTPVRELLRPLFEDIKIQYEVQENVLGDVTIWFDGAPVSIVVRAILRQIEGTFRIDGGRVIIYSKTEMRRVLRGEYGTVQFADEGEWITCFIENNVLRFHKGRMKTEKIQRIWYPPSVGSILH